MGIIGSSINIEAWNRREVFEFFSSMSNPFYMVTFRQDVTKLYDYAKKHKLSFYYALCGLVTQAVNSVDEFHYAIRGGHVYRIDNRMPSFTDLNKGAEVFHIVTVKYNGNLVEFCENAALISHSQKGFIDLTNETDELIYLSCLPWIDVTAITHDRDLSNPESRDDSIPRISWGKYTETDGKKTLGMSVEVNHRLIDGIHIGMFAEKLTELINAL